LFNIFNIPANVINVFNISAKVNHVFNIPANVVNALDIPANVENVFNIPANVVKENEIAQRSLTSISPTRQSCKIEKIIRHFLLLLLVVCY